MNRVAKNTLLKTLKGGLNRKLLHCSIEDNVVGGAPKGIQNRLRYIRTDLDRFNAIEVSGLINHGRAVALDHMGKEYGREAVATGAQDHLSDLGGTSFETASRVLEKSSERKWRIFYWRDWTSYLLLAIVAAIILVPVYELIVLPHYALERTAQAVDSATTSGNKRANDLELMGQQLADAQMVIETLKKQLGPVSGQRACRIPSNGIGGYKTTKTVTQDSGWMGGEDRNAGFRLDGRWAQSN
jgi:hypothetical protein